MSEKKKDVVYISSSDSDSESSKSNDILVGPTPPKEHEPGICWMCDEDYISIMTYPCNHAVLCETCYVKLPDPKKCPYCGALVTKVVDFILC